MKPNIVSDLDHRKQPSLLPPVEQLEQQLLAIGVKLDAVRQQLRDSELSLQAAVLAQRCGPEYSYQPGQPLGPYPVMRPHEIQHPHSLIESTEKMHQPSKYRRLIKKCCKGLGWALFFWVFFVAQPDKLLMAHAKFAKGLFEVAYQGFNCGWTSEVANVWTCDK